ncbi:hypothetical protein PDESU_00952 [Pontiella desulfatans]|uniref:Uncharacterized protein n=1 Tax=Pontiella desulfatans TaxID=2750659 RepID=A0A6C2TXM5_PONDE|nr:hypothetical protein [Pontiella desulfatans]VGO12400.1 hypothetical protein PDESU_00952 [Pontiella desulfatans]
MHNLHIIVARADSAEEAMAEVDAYIDGWGDENNWRSIAGAVDANGAWYAGEADSRYTGPFTLEVLNRELMDAVRLNPDPEVKHAITMLAAGNYDGITEGTPAEVCGRLYALKEFVDRLHAVYSAGLSGKGAMDRKGPLCVFGTRFRPWEYTEFGVTHMDDERRSGMRYAVLLDMHS